MANEAGKLIGYVDNLREILSEIPSMYENNDKRIERIDKENGDLLHALELLEIDEQQAVQYTNEIRNNRLERRKCKDENLILKPLYDFIKQNPKVAKEIRICQQETKRMCGVLRSRTYNPRVREDLTELFVVAKEKEAEQYDGTGTDL
jgi:predicted nuclease with TOPRIM domain